MKFAIPKTLREQELQPARLQRQRLPRTTHIQFAPQGQKRKHRQLSDMMPSQYPRAGQARQARRVGLLFQDRSQYVRAGTHDTRFHW